MKTLIISLKIFLFFTILTGIIYPLLVTGIAQLAFPSKANGSLIIKNNRIIGSKLLGQQFDSSIYFNSRPSAISYIPMPSGASNLALSNSKLKDQVADRREEFILSNQLNSNTEIPSEMLFASASGLDPHITPEAALLQVHRILQARNGDDLIKNELISLVNAQIEYPQFGILGEKRVNVFLLNLKTDSLFSKMDTN